MLWHFLSVLRPAASIACVSCIVTPTSISLDCMSVCLSSVCLHVRCSLFPFPAEPYTAALRAGKRIAHHLILYFTVRVDSTQALCLSVEECDAAVWVPLSQLPMLLDADQHGHYNNPPPPPPSCAAGCDESHGAAKATVGAVEAVEAVEAVASSEARAVALPSEYPRAMCATRHILPLVEQYVSDACYVES